MSADKCSECGALIPAGSPDGLCGKCLLALGLDEEAQNPKPAVHSPESPAVSPSSAVHNEQESSPTRSSILSPLSSALTEVAGDRIGHYKLLAEIGEGGFGVVYLAEQLEPVKRRVALKIIKLGMDTRQVVARFEAERQALALMDHPNIAKVLDAGATDTGRSYFVMELVQGVKITDYCEQKKLSTRQRLELFIQICRAIQHAHQKGIVHRDIKPSNILVSLQDGVSLPKVIDFGIAKATQAELTEQTIYTEFGRFIGTPAYMSPEQTELSGLDIDTRSDIYSLGVLLYELLTGVTPFDSKELIAAGLEEMRRIIREREPPTPSTRVSLQTASGRMNRRAGVPQSQSADASTRESGLRSSQPKMLIRQLRGDLDWVVMKCLEKDRRRRYETANGLAMDIERYLDEKPVTARPPSRLYEFQKTVRRHKFGFAAAGAVIAVLAGGILASTYEAVRAKRAQREQSRFRQDAEQARNQLAVSVSQMELREIRRAEEWFAGGESSKALAHLALLLRQNPSNYIAGQRLMSALTQRRFARLAYPPLRHADRITWAQYSPDGRLVVTTSADATAMVWDSTTGQPRAGPFRHEKEINMADFSPDGQWLVTASMDNTARIWDIANGKPVTPPLVHAQDVLDAHFSPDAHWVVTASLDGTVRVWEAATGRMRFEPLHCNHCASGAEFSPRGDRVLAASLDKTARLWDAITGKALMTFNHAAAVSSAHFSPDGRRIVTGSQDRTARLWDADTGQPIGVVMEHGADVGSAEFSPDGHSVATVSWDHTARIWNGHTGQPISPPLKCGDVVRSAHFSADGRQLVTTSWDKTARVWDAQSGVAFTEPLPHEGRVFWAEFHPDGQHLLTAYNGNSAEVWDISIPSSAPTLLGQFGTVTSSEFSPDGKMVAMSSDYGAWVWNAESAVLQKALIIADHVAFACFSSDGRWLVTGQANQAQIWDAQAGVKFGPALIHSNEVVLARFSPDGRQVLTAAVDHTARIWDTRTGQALTGPLQAGGRIADACFSQDGRLVATATGDDFAWTAEGHRLLTAAGDHAVRIWEATTGQQLFRLQHEEEVNSVQFSPDGELLLTACHYSVGLWDSHTGQPRVGTLRYPAGVRVVGFSSDGTRVVITLHEGSAQIREAITGKLITSFMGTAPVTARMSSDGRRSLAADDYGALRLWDINTGLPLTDELKHPAEPTSAKFSPEERWALTTAKWCSTAFLWDIPLYPLPVQVWVPELAEALAGQRLDALGRAEFVSAQNVLEIQKELERNPGADAYARWARWFFAQDWPRAISPNSPVKLQAPGALLPGPVCLNQGARDLAFTNAACWSEQMTNPAPAIGFDDSSLSSADEVMNAKLTLPGVSDGSIKTFRRPPPGAIVGSGDRIFGVSYGDRCSQGLVLLAMRRKPYDVAADFSNVRNPNGEWSYGWSDRLGHQLVPYTDRYGYLGIDFWCTNLALAAPCVYRNSTVEVVTNYTRVAVPGGFGFHPGPNGEFSITRFTAPTRALYRVMGSFFGQDAVGPTTDVHILTNGIPVFNGEVIGSSTGAESAFDLITELNMGDHLDFAVGYGRNNSYWADWTGLSAQISVLEPVLRLEPLSREQMRVSWPSRAASLVLQSSTNPGEPASWQVVTNVPTLTSGWFHVTNSFDRPRVYRLSPPPANLTATQAAAN